jgi:hypothetical protein
MVEVGPSTRMLGPAAIAVLLVLAGAVADGGRGDAGYPNVSGRHR